MIKEIIEKEGIYINLHALPTCEDIFSPSIKYEKTLLEKEYYFQSNYTTMFDKLNKDICNLLETDYSRYTTMGTTFTNMAILFAILDENSKVLVDDTCHQSIFETLSIIKPHVSYFENISDCKFRTIDFNKIDSKGKFDLVIITNGSYEGMTYNMIKVVEKLKTKTSSILIDEAWNFTLNFDNDCNHELSGIRQQDDDLNIIVTHSLHKTTPCMRQASLVSVNGCKGIIKKIDSKINALHTTSPNYNIIISIEVVMNTLASSWNSIITAQRRNIKILHEAMNSLDNIQIFEVSSNDMVVQNPYKILFQIKGLTTKNVYHILRENNIYVSYISDEFILFHIMISITEVQVKKIINVLTEINEKVNKSSKKIECIYPPGRVCIQCEEIK